MRFFISANIKENRPLYYLVLTFLILLLIYWLSSWFFFYNKYGFTYSSIFRYFFGDPNFPEKISLAQLFEDMHVEIFLKAFYLLVLFSLFLLSSFPEKLKITFIAISTLSAVTFILSDIFVLYFSPLFIYIKLISFFLFQAFSGMVILLTLFFLIFMGDNKPTGMSNIKFIIFVFSFFLLLFTIVNFPLFFSKMGFTPESIKSYYLGNPSTFSKPKTLDGMFKIFYPHILSMAVYSLAVAHLLLFTSSKGRVLIGSSLFLLSFLDNVSGFFVRFVFPQIAVIKVIIFLFLQVVLLYTSLLLFLNSKT
ncbi:hypothetical protein [Hydrogenobacter thermophilus]|uniref:hypothetical protein n=1 Tax=Hydrogenobacter thermophilus TaxID=940 RepID=UPI0030FA67FC